MQGVDIIPKAALYYIKRKNLKVGFSYKDVWREEHAAAFTVAKAMQLDVLSDMHNAVAKAIEKGQSFESFKKNIAPALQQKGWWGRRKMTDPVTGETVNAQLGSDRRLKTIYNVNMRSAFQKGQYDAAMASDLHPYLMYRIGPSVKHREDHQSWDGLVLPKDDPWWDSHFPPNGWGCKCYTRALTEARKKQYEENGIPTAPRPDGTGGGNVPAKTQAPPVKYKTYFNERKGTVEQVPEGVDPAFNWNQGKAARDAGAKAALENAERKYAEAVGKVEETMADRKRMTKPIEKAAAKKPEKEGGESSAIRDKLLQDMKTVIGSEKVELSNLSDEVVKEIYNRIDLFYKENPAMKGLITSMDMNEKDPTAPMSMGISSGEFHLSRKYYEDHTVEEMEKDWKAAIDGDPSRGIEKGYHPPNTTWQSSVDHEIGHAIEAHIRRIERANPDRDYYWTLDDLFEPILEEAGVDIYDPKKVKKYIIDNLSGYPAESYRKNNPDRFSETLAEAFMESRCPNTRPFALAVSKAVMPYLKIKVRR